MYTKITKLYKFIFNETRATYYDKIDTIKTRYKINDYYDIHKIYYHEVHIDNFIAKNID